MLFNDKYKDADDLEQRECDGDTIAKAEKPEKCFRCPNETSWCSISFWTFFCSEECLTEMWNEYFDAVKNLPVREDLMIEFDLKRADFKSSRPHKKRLK